MPNRTIQLPTPEGTVEAWDDLHAVADLIGASYDHVCDLVNAGELKARKVGRRRVVKRSDLAAYLEGLGD